MPNRITLSNLTSDMYKEAHSQNMTLSMYLENQDPTPDGGSLDAFERLMKEAGIITQSNSAKNYSASSMEAFYRTNENKALFPEYIARTFINELSQFPLYDKLVATRTGIDSNVYTATYLDFEDPKNKKALEMRRVTEGSDLPTAKLRLGKVAMQLFKYGLGIEATYEALRRMNIDIFNMHMKKVGAHAADNKVAEILTVIKDGDGNDNAAPQLKSKTDLDSTATAGILTEDAWLKFLLQFYPFGCDTIVANTDGLMQILKIMYPKSEARRMINALTDGVSATVNLPQNLWNNVNLIYSPHIEKIGGKEAIYGLNSKTTIEEVYELGSLINESDKFIKNQTNLLTISENSGFRKVFKDTSKILIIE